MNIIRHNREARDRDPTIVTRARKPAASLGGPFYVSAQTDPGYRSRISLVSALTFVFGLFILWIIYTADTGRANPFIDLIRPIPFGDKVGHVVLYGLLTLGANLSSRCQTFRLGRLVWYRGSLVVAVFALLEELTQIYIPSRAWDRCDLAADAVGIVLFSALSTRLWVRTSTTQNYGGPGNTTAPSMAK